MRTHLLSLISLFTGITAFGQTEVDLYRYSNTVNEGSARFEAMGGSFGALGAESGAARINPAGFARFSASQFDFGLSNISISNTAGFNLNTVKTNDNRTRLATLGVVLTSDVSAKRNGWLYQQLGIGYNSIANFGNELKYSGEQFASLLDGFASQANGYASDELFTYFPFSSSMAYETYTINPDGSGGYSPELNSGNVMHTRTINTKGGMGEMYFSYSGNYLNKLYIGANIGLQFLNYTENVIHHEDVLDTSGITLLNFDYYNNLKTRGNGANIKIGAIYLPVESVRLGLALHSPTFFNLTDVYDADMTAQHKDGFYEVPQDLKPLGNYKYRLRTPSRIIGSFAYVFENHGCINVDVEYLDYRWANFKTTNDQNFTPYDFQAENEAADTRFTSAFNTRVGGEIVIAYDYFIRGGVGFIQKADKELQSFGGKYDTNYSGGIGARFDKWTIDAAVKQFTQTRIYSAFPDSRTDITTKSLYIVLSAQFKF